MGYKRLFQCKTPRVATIIKPYDKLFNVSENRRDTCILYLTHYMPRPVQLCLDFLGGLRRKVTSKSRVFI